MTKNIYNIAILSGALFLFNYSSCKKYEDAPPIYEELNKPLLTQRKVLLISIDGATGSEIQSIAPPTISALQKNAKYTYNLYRPTMNTDASTWASMLTGVSYNKHLVSKDNFDRDLSMAGNDFERELPTYRNVFSYISEFKNLKTAIVTSWLPLQKYVAGADFYPKVTTDLAVKDSAVDLMTTQNTLGALIVNFKDVETAGKNGGYTASNPTYKTAVLKSDEYINSILTALKARKNYDKEEWLIIITTNHGGNGSDFKNGFFLAYNKNFKEEELKKNDFSTVNFKTDNIKARVLNDNGLYNMGANKDFTVQVQIKINNQDAFYPQILGKSTSLKKGAISGWYWMQEASQWNLEFGGASDGGKSHNLQLSIPGAFSKGQWRTLTMTVKYIDAKTRTASAYVDGVFKDSYNIIEEKSINTTEPLTIGGIDTDGGEVDFYAANLAIFNVALDPQTIGDHVNLKDITSHPFYRNLIGFWPIDDGIDYIIQNKAAGGYDMQLTGPFIWRSLGNDVPSGVTVNTTPGVKSVLASNTSVMVNMLYWMNIKILPEYNLDGVSFLDQFEIEFVK